MWIWWTLGYHLKLHQKSCPVASFDLLETDLPSDASTIGPWPWPSTENRISRTDISDPYNSSESLWAKTAKPWLNLTAMYQIGTTWWFSQSLSSSRASQGLPKMDRCHAKPWWYRRYNQNIKRNAFFCMWVMISTRCTTQAMNHSKKWRLEYHVCNPAGSAWSVRGLPEGTPRRLRLAPARRVALIDGRTFVVAAVAHHNVHRAALVLELEMDLMDRTLYFHIFSSVS